MKVGERDVRKFVCLVIRFLISNEGESLLKIAGVPNLISRSCIILCGVYVLPVNCIEVEVFTHTCLEAFPECVSSWPRHLWTSQFRTWFSLYQWGYYSGRRNVCCALCIIDGDLGCQKSTRPWISDLQPCFPTSINFPFTSLHFQTLVFPLCPAIVRRTCRIELALFLEWA